MKFAALLLVIVSSSVFSQQTNSPKPESKKKSPPVMTEQLKKEFFKAQLELQQASAAYNAKVQNAQAVNVRMTEFCGPDNQPAIDPKDNEPYCVEKPKPVDPPKK